MNDLEDFPTEILERMYFRIQVELQERDLGKNPDQRQEERGEIE